MKRFIIAAAVIVLTGCATPSQPQTDLATEAWNRDITVLDQKFEAKEITALEVAKETAKLAQIHFPQDYAFQSLLNYRVLLESRLERGDIKKDEFDYLWSEKVNALRAEQQQQHRQHLAQQQAQRDGATAIMLQGIGNAFRNSAPRPGVHCTSTNYGGTVMTNCN